MWLASAGWSLLLGARILQAVDGESPDRLAALTGTIVFLALLALAVALALTLRALPARPPGPPALLD